MKAKKGNGNSSKHRRVWQLLLQTNRDISSVVDLQELLSLISQRSIDLLDADDCVIFKLEEDGVCLRPVMGHGSVIEHSMGCPLKVGQGITGHSIATNRALVANYAQNDPRSWHVPGTPIEEEEHILVTPLDFRGKIIGAMLVNRINKAPFDQEDLSIFRGFAAQVAIAIENARLYEKQKRYTQNLKEMVDVRTAQVEQQARWLETILQTVQDALIVTDCDGSIRMINPAALALIQKPLHIVIDKPIQEVIDTLTNGSLIWLDGLPEHRQGSLRLQDQHYQYSLSSFEDMQTGRSGYVFILTDVTLLQRLNNLKTQMIQIASHDLRSPITAMGLQIHMLSQNLEKAPEKLPSHISRLEKSLVQLKDMITELLDVERIEQRASGITDAIHIQFLVSSAVAMIEEQVQQKQQKLTYNQADDIPVICGDPVRILEAIRNLLTNAHKYTPVAGYITVEVSGLDDRVCVKVRDTGIGIPEDDLSKVFDPNFRTSQAKQSDIEGFGVGLSLVKSIVEEHKGRLIVSSQVGQGSTFGFELPVNQSCIITE